MIFKDEELTASEACGHTEVKQAQHETLILHAFSLFLIDILISVFNDDTIMIVAITFKRKLCTRIATALRQFS